MDVWITGRLPGISWPERRKHPVLSYKYFQPRSVVDFLFAENPDVCFKIHSDPNVHTGELVRCAVSRK